jgi:hypothetical protein
MSLDIWLGMDVDTGGEEPYFLELFNANGIYTALWSPEKLLDCKANPTAGMLIDPLEEGLEKLKSNPDYFKKFDSPNGWGVYEHFVPFVEKVLDACKKHPKATVFTSR